jgi:hypothetical protein
MMRSVIAAIMLVLLAGPTRAEEWSGTWGGSYVCAQGDTGLALHLRERVDGTVGAIAHFFPLPHNPLVSEGCYEMQGRPQGGELALQSGRWLLRPSNYFTTDIEGRMTPAPDARLYLGRVLGLGCTLFVVRQGAPVPPLPAACRPDALLSRR